MRTLSLLLGVCLLTAVRGLVQVSFKVSSSAAGECKEAESDFEYGRWELPSGDGCSLSAALLKCTEVLATDKAVDCGFFTSASLLDFGCHRPNQSHSINGSFLEQNAVTHLGLYFVGSGSQLPCFADMALTVDLGGYNSSNHSPETRLNHVSVAFDSMSLEGASRVQMLQMHTAMATLSVANCRIGECLPSAFCQMPDAILVADEMHSVHVANSTFAKTSLPNATDSMARFQNVAEVALDSVYFEELSCNQKQHSAVIQLIDLPDAFTLDASELWVSEVSGTLIHFDSLPQSAVATLSKVTGSYLTGSLVSIGNGTEVGSALVFEEMAIGQSDLSVAGGLLYVGGELNGNCTIADSVFSNNKGNSSDGGIASLGAMFGTVSIRNVTVESNEMHKTENRDEVAANDQRLCSSFLFVQSMETGSLLSIKDSKFKNNYGGECAVALALGRSEDGAIVEVSGSDFSENKALSSGLFAANASAATWLLSECTFTGNELLRGESPDIAQVSVSRSVGGVLLSVISTLSGEVRFGKCTIEENCVLPFFTTKRVSVGGGLLFAPLLATASVLFEDCDILRQNVSGQSFGVLISETMSESTVAFGNCVIEDNFAYEGCGLVSVNTMEDYSTVLFDGCEVRRNAWLLSDTTETEAAGGVLQVETVKRNSSVALFNSLFANNGIGVENVNASLYGGGVMALATVLNSAVAVVNCTFDSNQALHYGGALYIHQSLRSSTLALNGSTFNGSEAHFGGAVSIKRVLDSSQIRVDSCAFLRNVAHFGGGAMHFGNQFAGALQITDSDFDYNWVMSGIGGGALVFNEVNASASVRVSSTSFFRMNHINLLDDKYSTNGAKGVHYDDQYSVAGGVLAIGSLKSGAVVRFDDCAFEQNVAHMGGVFAVHDSFDGQMTFDNCTFDHNSAKRTEQPFMPLYPKALAPNFDEGVGTVFAIKSRTFKGKLRFIDSTFTRCFVETVSSDWRLFFGAEEITAYTLGFSPFGTHVSALHSFVGCDFGGSQQMHDPILTLSCDARRLKADASCDAVSRRGLFAFVDSNVYNWQVERDDVALVLNTEFPKAPDYADTGANTKHKIPTTKGYGADIRESVFVNVSVNEYGLFRMPHIERDASKPLKEVAITGCRFENVRSRVGAVLFLGGAKNVNVTVSDCQFSHSWMLPVPEYSHCDENGCAKGYPKPNAEMPSSYLDVFWGSGALFYVAGEMEASTFAIKECRIEDVLVRGAFGGVLFAQKTWYSASFEMRDTSVKMMRAPTQSYSYAFSGAAAYLAKVGANSRVALHNCDFTEMRAVRGGVLAVESMDDAADGVYVDNCTFALLSAAWNPQMSWHWDYVLSAADNQNGGELLYGGGVFYFDSANGGHLRLSDCTFKSIRALTDFESDAVFDCGQPYVSEECYKYGYGALLFAVDEFSVDLTIENCEFSDLRADRGGLMYIGSRNGLKDMDFVNSNFENIGARYSGGLLHAEGSFVSSLTFRKCNVSRVVAALSDYEWQQWRASVGDMVADSTGGVLHFEDNVYASGGQFSIADCRFSNVYARDSGGFMHMSSENELAVGSLSVANCVFANCSAAKGGVFDLGRLNTEGSQFVVSETLFDTIGGGVLSVSDIYDDSSVVFKNCDVRHVHSAFYVETIAENAQLRFEGGTLVDNFPPPGVELTDFGGVIRVDVIEASGALVLDNVLAARKPDSSFHKIGKDTEWNRHI